jgi:hypothetical protein
MEAPNDCVRFLHELYNLNSMVEEDGVLGDVNHLKKVKTEIEAARKNMKTLATQREASKKRSRGDQDNGSDQKGKKKSRTDVNDGYQLLKENGFCVKVVPVYDFGQDKDYIQPINEVSISCPMQYRH